MYRICLSLALTALLGGPLSGCATYEKCGFKGCAGDAQITAAVRAALAEHPDLQASGSLSVRSLDHVVYLSGMVATDFQKDTAAALAAQVGDVKSVVNNIGVDNGSR